MESWIVDIQKGEAEHPSGMALKFRAESEPASRIEAYYSDRGRNAALQAARMIRDGVETYRRAYKERYKVSPLIQLRLI